MVGKKAMHVSDSRQVGPQVSRGAGAIRRIGTPVLSRRKHRHEEAQSLKSGEMAADIMFVHETLKNKLW